MCTINNTRFALTVLVGSLVTMGLEWLIHGNLLMADYEATASLWRPMEEMQAMMPETIARVVILNILLLFIFTRNYEGRGLAEGARYGLYMGVLLGFVLAGQYLWMPIPALLAVKWLVTEIVFLVILGMVYAAVYKGPSKI